MTASLRQNSLDPRTAEFYRRAIATLEGAEIPFLVGGAYAFARYAGIERHTKDFDLFVLPPDAPRALEALGGAGYRTDLTFSHWLGKAFLGDDYVDVIFGSGNGIVPVDDEWFEYSVMDQVLGVPVRLCPAEEIIWSKAFIMERERFDGADIAHLLRSRGDTLDWERLVRRFSRHLEVLFAHLVLFRFVYPDERDRIPAALWEWIVETMRDDNGGEVRGLSMCRGTLLSRTQYLPDVDRWGYRDARLAPWGAMSATDIAEWTAAAFETP